MSKLRLSYHAHLRRIKRIHRAGMSVQREKHGYRDFAGMWADFERIWRLEEIAWRQFHRSRQRGRGE